jgi:hypothetical protein
MSDWINVNHRLPKDDGAYLVNHAGNVEVMYFQNIKLEIIVEGVSKGVKDSYIWSYVPGVSCDPNDYPTWEDLIYHWMPLPQPPKAN